MNWYKIAQSQDEKFKSVVSSMEFLPTRKKALRYHFYNIVDGIISDMPSLSYGVNDKDSLSVDTETSDGKETTNTAMKEDIVMSGPSSEKYVVKKSKFHKMYTGEIGEDVEVEQSPRMVAEYTGDEELQFTASWGENMILKPGDYIVKEADSSGYYRIAKKEYEETYNIPGS